MKIEIDEELVKRMIFKTTETFKEYLESLLESPTVLLSADKYYGSSDLEAKTKMKYLIYADMIIAMKNLGHHYYNYSFESAPYNLVFQALALPHYTHTEFLDDPKSMQIALDVYKILEKSSFVGDGSLKELNMPKILLHTPYYDGINLYYKSLFLISKYTTLVDKNMDMKEFEGLYAYSNYIDIDLL